MSSVTSRPREPPGLRDFSGLREYAFAAYCAGEATRWAATAVIPTDDVERAIEGAQQVQREDGCFREHCERALGAPPGKRGQGDQQARA